MARGFGHRQRRELSTLTRLTLQGLGSLLYMTRGRPSSALTQLILQLWLTQISQLLRELQPTTTLDPLGSASKWPHQLPLAPEILVNKRDYELLGSEFNRLLDEYHPEGTVESYIFSTPDVPSHGAWELYQRAARRADSMYKWRYND